MAVIFVVTGGEGDDELSVTSDRDLRPCVGAVVERSSVFGSVTVWPNDFPRSLDLATETRPPAAQVSQSVPSGANAADAFVAQ